jgi:hypothetical protein
VAKNLAQVGAGDARPFGIRDDDVEIGRQSFDQGVDASSTSTNST